MILALVLGVVVIIISSVYLIFFASGRSSNAQSSTGKSSTITSKSGSEKLKKSDLHEADTINSSKKSSLSMSSKQKFGIACAAPEHPLFFREIGGHSVDVIYTASSPDGKIVASISRDGILRCIAVSDIGSANQTNSSFTKVAPDLSVESRLSWTPNSKRLAINIGNKISFYRPELFGVAEKKISEVKVQPTTMTSIYNVQLVDVEKWMVVAVAGLIGDEHCVQLYNHSGSLIATLLSTAYDTKLGSMSKAKHNHMKHQLAAVKGKNIILEASPDNRYIGISSFAVLNDGMTADLSASLFDINIYEVNRDSSGVALGLILRFVLSGHEGPVTSLVWDITGQRAITTCFSPSGLSGSSESTKGLAQWLVWSIPPVHFEVKYLLSIPRACPAAPSAAGTVIHVVFGKQVVFFSKRDIYICGVENGELLSTVMNAHGGDVIQARLLTLSQSIETKEGGRDLNEEQRSYYAGAVIENAKKICLWNTVDTR